MVDEKVKGLRQNKEQFAVVVVNAAEKTLLKVMGLSKRKD
jgi:hypothetical protein